jgi:hypothetical protein
VGSNSSSFLAEVSPFRCSPAKSYGQRSLRRCYYICWNLEFENWNFSNCLFCFLSQRRSSDKSERKSAKSQASIRLNRIDFRLYDFTTFDKKSDLLDRFFHILYLDFFSTSLRGSGFDRGRSLNQNLNYKTNQALLFCPHIPNHHQILGVVLHLNLWTNLHKKLNSLLT